MVHTLPNGNSYLKALKTVLGDDVVILMISDEEKELVENFCRGDEDRHTALSQGRELGNRTIRSVPYRAVFIDKQAICLVIGSLNLGTLKGIILAK